jgi:hypothetical protein
VWIEEVPQDDRDDETPAEVMSQALRALLEGVVDYAGKFPPASLDVQAAARNYGEYRTGDDRWMLGRFVIGIAKLPELRTIVAAMKLHEPWPVTVVVPDAAAATAALRSSDDPSVRIESVEVRAQTAPDVALIARAPKTREVYVEVPLDGSLPAMLDAIAAARLRAKVRTGGTTAQAFPSADQLVVFIRGCIDRNIPFKATAGLHHPLRGSYRLTYEAGAPVGEMYGYLNVFLAAAWMRAGLSDAEAAALLTETDSAAIMIEDGTIRWRDRTIDVESLRSARVKLATSFGSCSFREPVDELPYPQTPQATP